MYMALNSMLKYCDRHKAILVHTLTFLLLQFSFTLKIHSQSSNDSTIIEIFVKDYDSFSTTNDAMTPYHYMGRYIYEKLKSSETLKSSKHKYKFVLKQTNGSLHTLISMDQLTDENEGAIGIVQADVLYHYFQGNHVQFPLPKANSNVRAISNLFSEWLVITGPDTLFDSDNPLRKLQDVNAKGVGSGSLVTAINVNRILDLPWHNFHTVNNDDIPELEILVQSPSKNILKNGYNITGLTESQVKVLCSAFPSVYHSVTPAEFKDYAYAGDTCKKYDYKSKEDYNQTICVNAILIGSRWLNSDIIIELEDALAHLDLTEVDTTDQEKMLNDTIYSLEQRILTKSTYQNPLSDSTYSRYKNLPIAKHYELVMKSIGRVNRRVVRVFNPRVLSIIFILLLVTICFRFMLPTFTHINTYRIRGHERIKIISRQFLNLIGWCAIYILAHVLMASLIWSSEIHHAKNNFIQDDSFIVGGILGSVRSIFAYLTNGNQLNLYSSTALIWLGLLNISYALVGSFFAIEFSRSSLAFIKQKIRMDKHVVIIGWDTIAHAIIEELNQMDKKYKIIGSIEKGEIDSSEIRKHYTQIKAINDLNSSHVFAENAETIILISDKTWAKSKGYNDVDLWALNVLEEITLFKVKHKSKFRIVAQVSNNKHKSFMKKLGADEVICVNSFGSELLAHAATRPRLSEIYDELLTTREHNNEIYLLRIKDFDINKELTYGEATTIIKSKCKNTNSDSDNTKSLDRSFIPIGILFENSEGVLRDRQTLNPKDEVKMSPMDQLIVIAKEPIDPCN
ncbi:MAG: hypothetical protein GY751_07160 [Bacteroidetes bacterium]|nr:hypothetical protein [Bacteroidota bacterium]